MPATVRFKAEQVADDTEVVEVVVPAPPQSKSLESSGSRMVGAADGGDDYHAAWPRLDCVTGARLPDFR